MKVFGKLIGSLLLLCCGCADQTPQEVDYQMIWEGISGRDSGKPGPRLLIYRVKTPRQWEKRTPSETESIFDSTKPLAEFLINEGGNSIRVTIHNFPTNSFEERIAPAAQIARWKRQFEYFDEVSLNVQPIAQGGFSGLFFEAAGILEEKEIKVLGWSMQLSPEHYRNLFSSDAVKQNDFKQLRSDYTIKAVGPVELMERHKSALINFSKSFELIEEIPARP
jgi:hypothetical protein